MELIKVGINEKKGVEIIKTPNAETLRAVANIDAGIGLTTTKSHEDLMEKLNS
ncbi:MAG: hypothetical protein LBE36_12100 [Flavobacteriaceae bacterium]|nr:hypothetical protein [Flavobacteriaceae bacterium]